MELTPKTRKEVFLAAAGGQDVTTPTPVTREEVFLDAIAKGGGGGGSSGGVVLVANTSYSEDGETITADKTASEMWSAAQGGIILAKSVFTGMTRIELVTTAEYSDETGYIFTVGSNYSLYASAGTDYPRTGAGDSGANY